ncbi:Hypothetical protein R9X50_00590200 [Acrodontium crateriforme]|uniref:Uncharacterized protein n=1 Tax=Acrodontium crateriforme TaxID=150365 RepID=A0AAQ3RDE3_9PEZI|nr:Hypothetical protein R9X50_00590200 [Acrodontium crateriforme]
MPRPRKRAASPAHQEEEVEEMDQETTQPLAFDEPITWKAGRQIPVSDLLPRLKTLAQELAQIEQQDADRESLVPKAQDLANAQLLGHKDKGVRAWTMLCIVNMFRLLAPNAPYKGGQLKQIFDIFISIIIPALASPSDPYFQQYFQVLVSLTTVKSIVLLADIPGADHLVLTLFSNCFDVLAGNIKGSDVEQLPKNIEYHMTNMLCILVDECGSDLSSDVVDVVLAQFLRADPNSLAQGKKGDILASVESREVSPAYNMARAICNTCGETMDRAVANYFTSVLIDASESGAMDKPQKAKGKKRTRAESEDESDDGLLTPPAETDLREVEKAHRLLRELWRSSPEVVRSVIPSMESEVSAENVQIRTMAVQTVGDMIAGVGAAGPPPPPILDPAALPSQSLEEGRWNQVQHHNVLLTPYAPHAFASVHPQSYQAFFDRHRDKSAQVRAAWATAAGRIIATSGGGKGLDSEQESQLLRHLTNMLVDQDEKVRLAAVQVLAEFDFKAVVEKLGSNGSVDTASSLLYNLADRVKDRKHQVRVAAMAILGRIWGVASGAIADGSERVRELLGGVPSKILNTMYSNDPEIKTLVQRVLYESLLPISYPPIKPKPQNMSDSQRIANSQGDAEISIDPDFIRAERILVLVRDLDDRAKKVLFALLGQQTNLAKYVEEYLKICIEMGGNLEDDNEQANKKRLDTFINALSKTAADPAIAIDHLRNFAKLKDRRNYQLIRFCYSPESDYRKIVKATKELTKRIIDGPSSSNNLLETLIPIVHSVSILVYNRSHVPAIMDFSRTDEKGLGSAAHEVLKEIAAKAPQVFKVHVHDLCETLKKQAPTENSANDAGAVSTLKACAGFARKFPNEMPKDRNFCEAMASFAMFGSPPDASKHAVTVLLASANKKEMYIKQLLKYCIEEFEMDSDHALSKLATLSQLKLVAASETEDYDEKIMAIGADKILAVSTPADDTDPEWTNEIEDNLNAKLWALKILVNSLRGMDTSGDVQDAIDRAAPSADKVYRLLNTLIEHDGELSQSQGTAAHYKSRLRLTAAIQLLKLSCNPIFDRLFNPRDFNRLAKIAQDPLPEVRSGFAQALKKYLGQGKLPARFYGFVFLYAFEPSKPVKDATMTWLKGRASFFARLKEPVMENVFARFLSLLAHHQDFSPEPEDLEEFVEYIMFYLKCVGTEENAPVIYNVTQRLKSVQDGIDPSMSENLYIISDIAEATVRYFQEAQRWSLQLYPGKARLPSSIFATLPSHAMAQEISEKRYAPIEALEAVEELVKASLKSKKRKSEAVSTQAAKKSKSASTTEPKKAAVRKTSKSKKATKKRASEATPSSDLRKSSRHASGVKNYADYESDDQDEEMEDWQAVDEEEETVKSAEIEEDEDDDESDQQENKENISSVTPPISTPQTGRKVSTSKKKKATSPSKPPARKGSRVLPSRTRSLRRGKQNVEVDPELSDAPSE